MERIIVAMDSFKGTLSSAQACEVSAGAVHRVLPDADVRVYPVADGGEGTAEALILAGYGRAQECAVVDPLGRPILVRYMLAPDRAEAYIDSAAASGITLLAPAELDPARATTAGTGMMISHAVAAGARHIYLGIGGTATVDGGIGLLGAMGFTFEDARGHALEPVSASLPKVRCIRKPDVLPRVQFTILCDVDAPLTGPSGAAAVFGPQKGATPPMVRSLDSGLAAWARVLGIDPVTPGTGAGGGIPSAMMALLGATLQPGAPAVMAMTGLAEALGMPDNTLVITGEGRIDASTLMGKTPYRIMRAAAPVPTVAFAGSVADTPALLAAGFADVLPIVPAGQPLHTALHPDVARRNLAQAVEAFCRLRKK